MALGIQFQPGANQQNGNGAGRPNAAKVQEAIQLIQLFSLRHVPQVFAGAAVAHVGEFF